MLSNIGRIGDSILCNSILDSAFRTYGTVDYLCGRHNAEIFRSESRLNQVVVYRNSLAGFVLLCKSVLSHRYDGFIDLKCHDSTTSLILARLFRSRVKTGCNRDRFRPFHRDAGSICALAVHKVEKIRRIGELAGLTAGEYKPSLALSPNSTDWFRRSYAWEQPFVLLNLSATHSDRMWPVENWARYVRGCGLDPKSILVNGLPRDQEMVRQLCRELPGAVLFQPRHFMDVAAAVAGARLVLTGDTGVVHACSALDKPIVALFCASSYAVENGPLSTRRLMIRPQHGRSVPDIDPEQAIAETQRHGLP